MEQAALNFSYSDTSLQRFKETADRWTIEKGQPYAVVDRGGRDYQVWPKSQVGQANVVYVGGA